MTSRRRTAQGPSSRNQMVTFECAREMYVHVSKYRAFECRCANLSRGQSKGRFEVRRTVGGAWLDHVT